ncbi:MAG: 4a-hydroxytetrahydrobiopterin dehydratase [Saprospiraceae bacterium]|nr:4a-hydroxytetrahydrobiopterin dehydratase [Saprospiraceae bacterium]
MENKKSDFPQKFPIGPDALSEDKLTRILEEELTEWKPVGSPLPENPFISRIELYREYRFEDFDKVIAFMTEVAVACNIFPHHPRWENTWTTLRVWLTTWDVKHIISYKDIMLARHMDRTYQKYTLVSDNRHTSSRKEKEKTAFLDRIQQLIAKDEIEQAFERLTEYTALNREKSFTEELILLTSRFNSIQKEKRQGRMSWEHTELETNKIRFSLLDLLKKL